MYNDNRFARETLLIHGVNQIVVGNIAQVNNHLAYIVE